MRHIHRLLLLAVDRYPAETAAQDGPASPHEVKAPLAAIPLLPDFEPIGLVRGTDLIVSRTRATFNHPFRCPQLAHLRAA
jgi:hypothetical protein